MLRYDLADHRPEKLDEGILSLCGGLVEVSIVILLFRSELSSITTGAKVIFRPNRLTYISNC